MDISGTMEFAAGQRGANLQVNYSLDNGATYNTKGIFSTVLDTAVVNLSRHICKGKIKITVPITHINPLQCIIKINMNTTYGVYVAKLQGSRIETILQVTEQIN